MNRKPIIIVVFLALIFSSLYVLYAQETAVQQDPSVLVLAQNTNAAGQPSSAATPTDQPSTESITLTKEGNVSLDFREADIRNVLRIIAYKSGVNIVAGPEVTGVVTIKLQEVPWKQALDVILQTYGYAYEQTGNIITVTTVDNMKKRREDASALSDQAPLITKTFILNYAKAAEVIQSIEKMRTERGSINYDERTNSLIIRDIPNNVDLIGEVVGKLDRTTPQVLIEAKIVETNLNNQENLGIDWVTEAAVSASKRPINWPFANVSNSIYAPDAFPGADPAKGVENKQFSYGTIDFSQFAAVLELLRTRTDTNILSNPRIVTLDNQSAKIVVGSQYPIPQYTYNEEQARLQVSGWEYKDIGIIFEVTPHVNNAGYVTIDLQPRITEIIDFVTVENTSLPRLSSEETKTSVMIKDGETLVIAGLIKDKVTNTKKKTPLLGDIPLFGLLFQKTEKSIVKTDLLIFLTPHIITPVESPKE